MIHHNGKPTSPPIAVARNMSQLAHDVVELAELQSALIRLELQGWWKQLVLPTMLMVTGAVLALSCLPVLIVSAGIGLAFATDWSVALCLLLAAVGAVLIAALIGAIGWMRFKAAQAPLSESRRELGRNLRWLKTVLKHRASPSAALSSTVSKGT